jgi:CHAT domain-containing protein
VSGVASGKVVLVEYLTTVDRTWVFGVRADFARPKIAAVDVSRQEMMDFVAAYFAAPDSDLRELRTPGNIRSLDEERFQQIFGPVVEPVLQWSEEGDTLVLVPHGIFHYLPLHALRVNSQYLIERNPVCYSPSASILSHCHRRRTGHWNTAAVFGDSLGDLPYAKAEAEAVAQMFGVRANIGQAANKAEVLRAIAAGPDVLHFAGHVRFHPAQPLKSHIVLAPAAGAAPPSSIFDPHLTADEIFGLTLGANLVVLSGCVSGFNERQPGDEHLGLTRAFIFAGAPSLVVSLWPVDDMSSSLLMQRFYAELQAGLSKAQALRNAQLHVKGLSVDASLAATGRDLGSLVTGSSTVATAPAHDTPAPTVTGRALSHPFYWAPFVLVGDWI